MEMNFSTSQPIYAQLKQHLSEAIITGFYTPGQRLPSVRDIAIEAEVNPNTVQRALSALEQEGLVFSHRTTGRFVTGDEDLIRKTRLDMALDKVKEFWKAMMKLGVSHEEATELLQTAKEETE